MRDRVLVIIVTYNAMRWIKKCIQSIEESTTPLDALIIDNLSSDNTVKYVTENYPSIKLIQNMHNLGFGAANNIGLQYAIDNNYDYVYLLNQDAWIKPNTVSLLIEVHKANAKYGILSPMQMYANEKVLDNDFKAVYSMASKDSSILSVSHVMAAHWLISRECILAVGGFSPSFYHYGEDDNYCDRVRYQGLKIGIVSTAFAVHDRENRTYSASQKLYQSYVRTIVYLSGFERTTFFALYGLICDCIKYLIKERSFLFLKYIKLLTCEFCRIKKNKKDSMEKTAFLHKA